MQWALSPTPISIPLRVRLELALRGKTSIVILDDVWRLTDITNLGPVDDAAGQVLITTRMVWVLDADEHPVHVPKLEDAPAR